MVNFKKILICTLSAQAILSISPAQNRNLEDAITPSPDTTQGTQIAFGVAEGFLGVALLGMKTDNPAIASAQEAVRSAEEKLDHIKKYTFTSESERASAQLMIRRYYGNSGGGMNHDIEKGKFSDAYLSQYGRKLMEDTKNAPLVDSLYKKQLIEKAEEQLSAHRINLVQVMQKYGKLSSGLKILRISGAVFLILDGANRVYTWGSATVNPNNN